MKKIALLVIVLLLGLNCFAQDVIVTKDGKRIDAVISEVDLDVVKYKRFDNQSGPTISIKKSDIVSIVYQSGGVEVFDEKQPVTIIQTLPAPTQKISTNYLQSQEYKAAKNLYTYGVVVSCVGAGMFITGWFIPIGWITMVPIGAGMIIGGSVCAGVGKSRMNSIRDQSLFSYNLLKTENSQLSLNVNPNSVGLSLKF